MNYFKGIWVPIIHLNTCIAILHCVLPWDIPFTTFWILILKIQYNDFVAAEQPQKNLDDAPQGEDEWEHISNVSVDTDGEQLVDTTLEWVYTLTFQSGQGHRGRGNWGQTWQQPLPLPGRSETELKQSCPDKVRPELIEDSLYIFIIVIFQCSIRWMAQGQEGCSCRQDKPKDNCTYHPCILMCSGPQTIAPLGVCSWRHNLQRNESCLRSFCRQEELGNCHGWVCR